MAQVKKWKIFINKSGGNSMHIYIDAPSQSEAQKIAKTQYPGWNIGTAYEVK